MKIEHVDIDGRRHSYLFIYKNPSLSITTLEKDEITTRLEKIGSSRFYRMPGGELCKISNDRFNAWSPSWFFRDIIERRFFLNSPAIREWHDNVRLSNWGIRTIPIYAAAVACLPTNPLSSFLVMPLLNNMRSGEDYYRTVGDLERNILFERIARDVAITAQNGYCHRDLHLGNLMVDGYGDIMWIDTHLKKLPNNDQLKRQYLCATFKETKLFGISNRNLLLSLTLEHYERLVK